MMVRTTVDPGSAINTIRQELQGIEPLVPVYDVSPLENLMAGKASGTRFIALLMGIFAGVALILAAAGIYGIMSYAVTQRMHEIGVRLALGAQTRDVLKMVLGQGMWITGIGLALGIGSAFVVTRLLSSLLFGVSPTDPVTFIGVGLLLAIISFLASYLPARRAMRVDPMTALRYE
jgi:ABC-type antimicrobial peptide transport system permease subunit